jgi:filamentous hemagglutinin family protein
MFQVTVQAEITLDGTLGPRMALPAPDYVIPAELGQQHGPNLFHSFETFNLNINESATFEGPSSISNILSRVTGGTSSTIDGALRSTIPNADFYFINPAGILFGPNASLDVQGSFHASTADTLHFSDNNQFSATNPAASLLTVAPVSAFGFLSDSPQSLSIESSKLTNASGKTLSFLGGHLQITNTLLTAAAGRINLASLASQGEVYLGSDLFVSANDRGHINLQNSELTVTEGGQSGGIYIRGGEFVLENTLVQSTTSSAIDAGAINIQVDNLMASQGGRFMSDTQGSGQGAPITLKVSGLTEFSGDITINNKVEKSRIALFARAQGNGGSLDLETGDLILNDGSYIATATFGLAQGGHIDIQATEEITLSGLSSTGVGSFIAANTLGRTNNAGESGMIHLEAKNLQLTDGAQITTGTRGPGQGGNTHIKVAETISLAGEDQNPRPSRILNTTEGSGQGGSLVLEAKQLSLREGTLISADSSSTGSSGNIQIQVGKLIKLEGINSQGSGSAITANANSQNKNAGDGGNIVLGAEHLQLADGAKISTTTFGPGLGGNVNLQVTQEISLSGENEKGTSGIFSASQKDKDNTSNHPGGDAGNIILITGDLSISERARVDAATFTSGDGGNIDIQAQNIQLTKAGTITAQSNYKDGDNDGDAGEILIETNRLIIKDSGSLVKTSTSDATGGNITIISADLLYLVQDGRITTSVSGGTGNGGNITIQNPVFIVLDQGQIKAQADEGRGGDIHLFSEQFLASNDSLVSASSRKNIDGQIVISAPDEIISEGLFVLSSNFHDASNLLAQNRCSDVEKISRLVVKPYTGHRASPSDWKASRLWSQDSQQVGSSKMPQTGSSTVAKALAGNPSFILLAECQPRPESTANKISKIGENKNLMPAQLF